MRPLLSVIIPTKDRYETLEPVLNVLVSNNLNNDLEIVVQDNTKDNCEFLKYLKFLNCSKIKYYHSENPISMTHNCELGVENSQGQYLLLIGDDDLVSPYIIDIISIVKEQNISCLYYTPGNYYWPGVKFIRESALRKASSLQISSKISSKLKEFKTHEVLLRHLESGAYGLGDLPRFYHGIISRETIEKVKSKFGVYIPGSSPDMAVSTAIALCISKHYYINFPVTVTGVSKNSSAGLGARGAHIAKIEEVSFLPKEIVNNWDCNVPRIWTGPTIYVQTVHEVLSKAGLCMSINYPKMYEYMYVFLPSTRSYLYPFIKREIAKNIFYTFSFVRSLIFWNVRKVLFLYFDSLKAKVIGIKQVNNVDSVEICSNILKSVGDPSKY